MGGFASIRMQSIYKMTQSYGKINPRRVRCLSEKLTDVQIDGVKSGSITTPPNVDKTRLWHRMG